MQLLICVLFSLFLLNTVHGHGWVNDPEPRGYISNSEESASTNGPCGRGNSGQYDQTATVTAGDTIDVNFKTGGGHTGLLCYFSTSETDTGGFSQITTPKDCPAATTYNEQVTIPTDTTPGINYLQWVWTAEGSTWYSCIQLNVLSSEITTVDLNEEIVNDLTCTELADQEPVCTTTPAVVDANGTTTKNETTTCVTPGEPDYNQYFRIPLTTTIENDRFISVTLTNTGAETLYAAASTLTIPVSYNNSDYQLEVRPGRSMTVVICTANRAVQYAFVTMFGPCAGDYEIVVSTYAAEVDFNNKQVVDIERIDSNVPIFFYSEATSTTQKSKRLVFSGVNSRSCSAYGTYRQCIDYDFEEMDTRCVDLPVDGSQLDHGTNYYSLYCSEEFEGTVSIEAGKCLDWEEPAELEDTNNSFSLLCASMALFLIALL